MKETRSITYERNLSAQFYLHNNNNNNNNNNNITVLIFANLKSINNSLFPLVEIYFDPWEFLAFAVV